MQKKDPLPPTHQKWNAHFWITFNFWWSAKWSEQQKLTEMWKGSLSHQKIECSFLDYVQLLMISWAIRETKLTKMQKRPPKSSKNEIFVFGLCSTSDDQLSDLSDESWHKCNKMPPKSSKNEMLIFGLCSTSDRQSNPSDESRLKSKKGPPKSSKNEMLIFG